MTDDAARRRARGDRRRRPLRRPPRRPEPPASPEANGATRREGAGRAPPKGKRGLRLPRRFKKAAPGSAAGIEPHELARRPRQAGLRPHHLHRLLARAGALRGRAGPAGASSTGTARSGRRCAGSTWTASATWA